jgi:hypothetical protein
MNADASMMLELAMDMTKDRGDSRWNGHCNRIARLGGHGIRSSQRLVA